MNNKARRCLRLLFFAVVIAAMPVAVSAQRDYLTSEEIEIVRFTQEIDKRMNVLVIAIDRRFEAMNINAGGVAPKKKELEKWGPPPEGTRAELLTDIKRILQKAIDDIDNLAERPNSGYIVDKDDPSFSGFEKLFPKAMRALTAAAERYSPLLRTEIDKKSTPAETGTLTDSLDLCSQIIEASKKLPPEVKKTKK